jgi:hypothetical protein
MTAQFGHEPMQRFNACVASTGFEPASERLTLNTLVLRRSRKTAEPFAGHLSSCRILYVGLYAGVRFAPVGRLAANDEVLGPHWAPLPGNIDLRTFSGLTPLVVVEHAAIHVVATVVCLMASPRGVFVVAFSVVVLSRGFCGE